MEDICTATALSAGEWILFSGARQPTHGLGKISPRTAKINCLWWTIWGKSTICKNIAIYVDGDRVYFEGCHFLGDQDTLFTGPLPPTVLQKNGFVGPKECTRFYKNRNRFCIFLWHRIDSRLHTRKITRTTFQKIIQQTKNLQEVILFFILVIWHHVLFWLHFLDDYTKKKSKIQERNHICCSFLKKNLFQISVTNALYYIGGRGSDLHHIVV